MNQNWDTMSSNMRNYIETTVMSPKFTKPPQIKSTKLKFFSFVLMQHGESSRNTFHLIKLQLHMLHGWEMAEGTCVTLWVKPKLHVQLQITIIDLILIDC